MATIQDPNNAGAANVVDAESPDFTGKKALAVAVANEGGGPTGPMAVRLSNGTTYYNSTTPNDTQPISATALPLPSGAATSAKQPTLGTAGSPSTDVISVQGVSSGTPIPVSGSVTATNASIGSNDSTAPSSSTQIAGVDLSSGKLEPNAVFDLDTGVGKEFDIGVSVRLPASGGSVAGGTATNPIRVDPTGGTSQPVSGTVTVSQSNSSNLNATITGTVTANIGTSGSLALDSTLTGGTAKSITRGGAKGATTAADVTGTAEGADHQALDVQIMHGGSAKDPTQIRALTSSDVVTAAQSTASNLNATVVQSTASNLNATVAQGTASNLKAQVTGGGSAGSPDTGVVTVQGIGSGTAIPISGSVTANIGTSGSLALDATLTGGTAKSIVRGGAKGTTTAADITSTAEGTDHQSLDVQIYHGGTAKDPTQIRALTSSDVVTAAQATAANLNATVVGAGSAGTPAGGVVSVQGVSGGQTLPVTAAQATAANLNATVVQSTAANLNATVAQSTAANLNATVVQGTAANLKAQVTGGGSAGSPDAGVVSVQGVSGGTSMPISGSVTANIGTSGSLALDATLTGGTSKTIVRGGAKGATSAADATTTAEGADHQALDVQIMSGGTAKDPTQIRALTSSDVVTAAQATAANLNATVVQATGTNLHAVIDSGSTTVVTQATASNLNAAIVGTKTNNNAAPGATNVGMLPALANAAAPSWTEGNQVALSSLLTGALRTDTSSWLGSAAPTVGQKTAANSLPVVIASDQPLPSDRVASGTLTGTGSVTISTQGSASLGVQVTGTWVGTLVSEVTINGTDWFSSRVYVAGGNAIQLFTFATNVNGRMAVGGYAQARIRCSAFTSGSIVINLEGSPSDSVNRSAIEQVRAIDSTNSSSANLAAGATFTGASSPAYGFSGIEISLKADQPCMVQCQQSIDGTNWDQAVTYVVAANNGDGRTIQATGSYYRVLVTNNGGSTTTFLRLQTVLCPIAEDVRPARDNNVTGTITALNGTVQIGTAGCGVCSFQITGTWVGTLVGEASFDGITWFSINGYIQPYDRAGVASSTTNLSVRVVCAGYAFVRTRAAAWTSGTANVFARSSTASSLTHSAVIQDVLASASNSTTANLAAGAAFTGTLDFTTGVSGIQISHIADQPCTVLVQQSSDGINWDITDTFDFDPGMGDSRTVQAVSLFFRVVVTNTGAATTTYLRTTTALCPMVEAVPRSVDDYGNLRVSSSLSSTGYQPDPKSVIGSSSPLLVDASGRLETHSVVSSDEGSFRDDFPNSSLITAFTGTLNWVNNSTTVRGVGTLFSTEVAPGDWIKKTADAETNFAQVSYIISDTELILLTAYAGTTAAGVASGWSHWKTVTPTGGALTVGTSNVTIGTGTTSGAIGSLTKFGDYLPYTLQWYGSVSQRIANQTFRVGFQDPSGSLNKQCLIRFTGTTNTQVDFVTASSSAAADVQATTVTLPNGGTTASAHLYKIDLSVNLATLSIDGVVVAVQSLHIPGPYDPLNIMIYATNTAGAGSNTNLITDYIYFTNMDRVQIDNDMTGEPISTKEFRSNFAATSSVAAAVADTSLLAVNTNRISAVVYNDSTSVLYLKYGTGASATSFTYRITAGGTWEMPNIFYTGVINGYWVAATGNARITELT